jgi:hypothetical protein
MGRRQKPTVQDMMRLDAIAKHLKVRSRFPDATFDADVKAACLAQIAPTIDKLLPCAGEDIVQGLAEKLSLKFEEVHGEDDLAEIEERYVKGKRELGFVQVRDELDDAGVDALLFQRVNATERDADRWVAILNLQHSPARGYWSRNHELSHRIAEPPQKILPFRRHTFEAGNPVEALIDSVASEIAFYGPAFRPLVEQFAKRHRLSFEVIDAIRRGYAPTASLQSTLNAVVKYWPRAATAVTATFRGRTGKPNVDQALRVSSHVGNGRAKTAGLSFFPNMRVPADTPIHDAFVSGSEQEAEEFLGDWDTSTGSRLAPINVFTSARVVRGHVYAAVSV